MNSSRKLSAAGDMESNLDWHCRISCQALGSALVDAAQVRRSIASASSRRPSDAIVEQEPLASRRIRETCVGRLAMPLTPRFSGEVQFGEKLGVNMATLITRA